MNPIPKFQMFCYTEGKKSCRFFEEAEMAAMCTLTEIKEFPNALSPQREWNMIKRFWHTGTIIWKHPKNPRIFISLQPIEGMLYRVRFGDDFRIADSPQSAVDALRSRMLDTEVSGHRPEKGPAVRRLSLTGHLWVAPDFRIDRM